MIDFINLCFELWHWAWNWRLPLDGVNIYPIQLGLSVWAVEVLLDAVIPILRIKAIKGMESDDDD